MSEGFSEAFPEWKPPEANKKLYLSKLLKPNLDQLFLRGVTKKGMESHVGCGKEGNT